MVDQRVAAEKQNGVGTPYIPPMTRRLKCRIDPEQSPYTCMLPEHKPVRRGREMIDLLAVEEPKPKPAKIRAVSYEAGIEQLFRRMRSFNEPNHRTSPSGRYCQPKQLEHRTYSSLCAAFAPQRLAVYSDENEQ